MKQAIAIAINPVINTAAAAVSLAFLANGCISGLAKSVRFSRLVLKASADKTIPMVRLIATHSQDSIAKYQPALQTSTIATK